MSTITGSCCCGRIEIIIPTPPADSLSVCHCTTCRKSTGALAEYCLKVRREDVKMDEGSMKIYKEVGSSGKTIERLFCPECGSRTFDRLETEPEWYYVQAGLFPPGTLPRPYKHIWAKNMEQWEEPISGASVFQEEG